LGKAVASKPDQPDTHFNLGNALSKKGDYDAAIAEFRKVLTLRPV
jgi:lipoprotein NlpI